MMVRFAMRDMIGNAGQRGAMPIGEWNHHDEVAEEAFGFRLLKT